jgi:hypothetical protein
VWYILFWFLRYSPDAGERTGRLLQVVSNVTKIKLVFLRHKYGLRVLSRRLIFQIFLKLILKTALLSEESVCRIEDRNVFKICVYSLDEFAVNFKFQGS